MALVVSSFFSVAQTQLTQAQMLPALVPFVSDLHEPYCPVNVTGEELRERVQEYLNPAPSVCTRIEEAIYSAIDRGVEKMINLFSRFSRSLFSAPQPACNIPAPKTIAILPKFADGMGDLAAMRKIWLHLSKQYRVQIVIPEVEKAFVQQFPELMDSVVAFDPKKGPTTDADLAISFPDNIPSDNFAEAFSAKNIRVLRLEEAGSSKESIYGAVIANLRKIGITTRAKVDAYLIQLHTMGIFDKTTIQQIPESLERIGFFVDSGATKTTHATGTHSLGVGPSEIGVMLDQQIIEYVNQGILHDPMKRLQLLKDLPYNIQKAIFGSGKTSSRETVEEFQKHSKLYFSYSKEKVANSLFCYAMASLEKEADLVFLLVRTPPLFFTEIKDISSSLWDLIKRDDALREMMVMNFFMEWENLGYHQLRFIWGNQQESVRSIALHPLRKGKKNRTITFISIESVLPHPQFQAALLGSERECQVRGEQSLFDALCAGKIPLNELSTDKGGMTYAMVEMAKSVDARFKGVAHTLLRTVHDHAQGNVLPKIISSIQQARGMGEEWYRLGQTIIHKHNFFPKLDTLVNPCGVSDPLRDR